MPSMQEDLKLDGYIITVLIVWFALTLTSQDFMSGFSLIPSMEKISPEIGNVYLALSWPNYDAEDYVLRGNLGTLQLSSSLSMHLWMAGWLT